MKLRLLDLTLETVAENLALDEALLDEAAEFGEVLRIWEAPEPAVILGRASRLAEEVDQPHCAAAGIPVYRRCSGGATVMIGPGCLMYAVVLSLTIRPELAVVDAVHRLVLAKTRQALQSAGLTSDQAGTSDLTWQGRKISGNSLRCKREAVLYHGTLLYGADIERIARCLRQPPRQPEYRQQRSHRDFLVNLPVTAAALRQGLADAWHCDTPLPAWPTQATASLVATRYGQAAWNLAR